MTVQSGKLAFHSGGVEVSAMHMLIAGEQADGRSIWRRTFRWTTPASLQVCASTPSWAAVALRSQGPRRPEALPIV